MQPRISSVIVSVFIASCLNAQTFYSSDDSVMFIAKVYVSKKDSLDKIRFSIKNNSSTPILICKLSFRNFYAYVNPTGGFFIMSCSCEYGFNHDFEYNGNFDFTKIDKGDSLIFEIPSSQLKLKKGRKMTIREFQQINKILKIDYLAYSSNSPIIDKKVFFETFRKTKKSISCFMEGDTIKIK
jgi:hypothetical protein